MRLSVIIVNWNTCQLLDRCLTTLAADLEAQNLLSGDSEVFVIDNASSDSSSVMVEKKYPLLNLIKNQDNIGFARANNQALKLARGEYILLLNPDTEVYKGAIETLINFLDTHPKAGVVAPQLLNPDGSIQPSCRAFPSFNGLFLELTGISRLAPPGSPARSYKMLDWGHNDERQVDQPQGACLLIRKELFNQIGFLDEGYFMLFEEVDWCYRAKEAGWQIWFTPKAKILHHLGQSIKQVKTKMILSSHRGMYRFWQKHHSRGKEYLSGTVYSALMSLAYMRILSYLLRQALQPLKATRT